MDTTVENCASTDVSVRRLRSTTVQKRKLNTVTDSVKRKKVCYFSNRDDAPKQANTKLFPIFLSKTKGEKQKCFSAERKPSVTHSVANKSKNELKSKSKCSSKVNCQKSLFSSVVHSPTENHTRYKERHKRCAREKNETSRFTDEEECTDSDIIICGITKQESSKPVTVLEDDCLTNSSFKSSSQCEEFCFPKFSHCCQENNVASKLVSLEPLLPLAINDAVPEDISVPQWTGIVGLLDDSVPVKKGCFDLSEVFKEIGGKSSEENCCVSTNENAFLSDLMWTDKYESEIFSTVCDNASVLKLKNWLLEWKSKFSDKNRQQKNAESSDSSEFEDDELENCVVVAGQPGCGKTSLVYSLAAELGYKVLEVNSSSCRSGRHIQSHLREAFQSYHVDPPSFASVSSCRIKKKDEAGDGSKQNRKSKGRTRKDIMSFFGGKNKVSNDVPKTVVKTSTDVESSCVREQVSAVKPSKLSMILFDDVDVVLEEDEGFWSTVNSFLRTTRKPVVLTASRNLDTVISQLAIPHKLIEVENPATSNIVKMLKLPDQQCSSVDLGLVPVYNSDDIRRCLLSLQFWSKQIAEGSCKRKTFNKFFSSSVMQNSECLADFQSALFCDKPLKILNGIVDHLTFGFDLLHDNLFACLVNLHGLPTSPSLKCIVPQNNSQVNVGELSSSKHSINSLLEKMAPEECTSNPSCELFRSLLSGFSYVFENFSYSDCIKGNLNGHSLCSLQSAERIKQWCYGTPVCVDDSLLGFEDLIIEIVSIINILAVSQAKQLSEMSCSLFKNSVIAKKPAKLQFHSHGVRNSEKLIRSVTSFIPALQQLNSRAVVLDYISALKTICCLEAARQSSNLKRSSRFLHYLDSISMFCNPSDFLLLQK